MAEPPELFAFVASNLIFVGFGCLLTALSYLAHRSRSEDATFRTAAVGFGLLALGGAVEPVYELGLVGGYRLAGRELLALQTAEGVLLALGLGMLLFSIVGYDAVPSLGDPSDDR